MKIIPGIILAAPLLIGQFTVPFARTTPAASGMPTFVSPSYQTYTSPPTAAATVNVTSTSGEPLTVWGYNSLSTTGTFTSTSGTVTALGCVTGGGNTSLCLAAVIGGTNPAITYTASSGYYLATGAFVASSGSFDGGLTCSSTGTSTTGCVLNGNTGSSITSGTFVTTATDLVLCTAWNNNGSTMTGAPPSITPVVMSGFTNGWYTASVAAGSGNYATFSYGASASNVAGCVAIHP